jgi:long-chain acyl-CoA synthetase
VLGEVDIPAPHLLVPGLLDRLASPGSPSAPLVVLDPSWPADLRARARSEVADAAEERRLSPQDVVLFTSGSSGSPRAVVRTIESWRASLQPLSDVTGIRPAGDAAVDDDAGPVWVPGPLTSSLFLYGALHAAWCGRPAVRGRAGEPDVERATAAHLVPTQLADAVGARHHGLLPHLRTVVVAGAHLTSSLREGARAAGLRVVEYYGAAELSFVGWRDGAGPFRDFPGARVRVDDDRVVWVRSPYVACEPLRSEDRGTWRQADGWHTVGDLGAVDGHGWTLLGRGDAVVTTGGHTVAAAEVEAVLRDVPGARDVVVVGLPHPRLGQVVVAVVVPDGSSVDGLRARFENAAQGLPAPARPRRWFRADRLPLLASGKVDRAALTADAHGLPPLR